MGQRCKVCQHPDRAKIEDMLIQGASNRAIACQFGVGYMSVQRHKVDCMPAAMLEAYRAQRRLEEVMNVPNEMHDEWEMLEALLDQALEPLTRLNASLDAVDTGFLMQLLRLRHRFFTTMLQVLAAIPPEDTTSITITRAWKSIINKLDEGLGDDEDMRTRFAAILVELPEEYRYAEDQGQDQDQHQDQHQDQDRQINGGDI